MKLQFLRILPALVWALIILTASLSASSSVPSISIPHLDKAVHFTLYCVFCWLLIYGLSISSSLKIIISAILIAVIYGAIMELLQDKMNQGRSAELLDILANTMGAITAGVTFRFFYKRIFG